mmetsp:Transcript_99791/g.213691  ORF Transcript_99791/g.213691 Transcript_99791/m.213691 type:complete len:260 (-) Transcript_99791:1549-2328(-)
MVGNFACGSVVSQQRKFGWGERFLISFSNSGTQLMTRCKFLRQIQSPDFAASWRSLIASSFCPPPMANWWNSMFGAVDSLNCLANSSSSDEGSPPGVVTKRMGMPDVDSSLWRRTRLRGGGDKDVTPSASQANCVSADSKRSGRAAWMRRTLWKEVMREKMEPSKDSSHLSDWNHGCQSASFPRLQASSMRGKDPRNACMACTRSAGTQAGGDVDGWDGGMKVPWNSSNSLGSNFSGRMPRTMCMPKVSLSALKRDLET